MLEMLAPTWSVIYPEFDHARTWSVSRHHFITSDCSLTPRIAALMTIDELHEFINHRRVSVHQLSLASYAYHCQMGLRYSHTHHANCQRQLFRLPLHSELLCDLMLYELLTDNCESLIHNPVYRQVRDKAIARLTDRELTRIVSLRHIGWLDSTVMNRVITSELDSASPYLVEYHNPTGWTVEPAATPSERNSHSPRGKRRPCVVL